MYLFNIQCVFTVRVCMDSANSESCAPQSETFKKGRIFHLQFDLYPNFKRCSTTVVHVHRSYRAQKRLWARCTHRPSKMHLQKVKQK